jgi:hypothetical protein
MPPSPAAVRDRRWRDDGNSRPFLPPPCPPYVHLDAKPLVFPSLFAYPVFQLSYAGSVAALTIATIALRRIAGSVGHRSERNTNSCSGPTAVKHAVLSATSGCKCLESPPLRFAAQQPTELIALAIMTTRNYASCCVFCVFEITGISSGSAGKNGVNRW